MRLFLKLNKQVDKFNLASMSPHLHLPPLLSLQVRRRAVLTWKQGFAPYPAMEIPSAPFAQNYPDSEAQSLGQGKSTEKGS